MPNACFIDTNVLLYAKDPKLPAKKERALEWLAALDDRHLAVINPQVMNEFAHNVLRKLKHISIDDLFANLDVLRSWCLAPMTDETAMQGLLIHQRYKFSFYDSTLVAAAITYGCDVFLSEDMSHRQRLGSLQIVNPFTTEPRIFLSQD